MDAITLNQLMQEGTPFMIQLSTGLTPAEETFDLDTETYDGQANFFENKMLWVSAMRVDAGAGEQIEGVWFDEVLMWFGLAANEGLRLDGYPWEVDATPIGADHASIKDRYGVPFLPIRNEFSLKNLAPGAGAASTITIWGVATARTA